MYWCIFSASSVLEQMVGVQVLSVRTSSVLIHMIGVHLLSVQVVYLVENETLGLHLLSEQVVDSVRTSSILDTHDWCTFTVRRSSEMVQIPE